MAITPMDLVQEVPIAMQDLVLIQIEATMVQAIVLDP
jgi:hypothetical protein